MTKKVPMARFNERVTLIIKTSFDCNLNCSYCYEGHRAKGTKISLDTIKALTIKASDYFKEYGTKFTFVWHGGEPLLMGQPFYEQAIAMQRECDCEFVHHNSLQTNGVLLDEPLAKTLIENKVGVGVSLDGPPVIHDAQRELRGKRGGSFMASYEALRILYLGGYQAGALAVFTRNTYNNLDAFYDFFSERELDVKMNPLFLGGNADNIESKYLQVSPREYKDSLIYLFNRWISDTDKKFSFDPFTSIIRSMTSGTTYSCSDSGACASFFKVFPNGDMHMCGLQPYEQYKLGNINVDNLSDIFASPLRSNYAKARESLAISCGEKCDYYDICHGGCVSYSYPLRGYHSDKTYYCESMKGLFKHMEPMVRQQNEIYSNMSEQQQACIF